MLELLHIRPERAFRSVPLPRYHTAPPLPNRGSQGSILTAALFLAIFFEGTFRMLRQVQTDNVDHHQSHPRRCFL
jgi:hypothetical protein